MLRINLTEKPETSKTDTSATYQIACLSSPFRRGTELLTRGYLKFEKIEHIQISLQTCKRHELPKYFMVTC